jgi:hypothetical protein
MIICILQVRAVCVWVLRHQYPLSAFKKANTKQLTIPGETRFGASVLCLQRYIEPTVANALRNVFSNKQYLAWEKCFDKKQREKAAVAKSIVFNQAVSSKARVLVKLLNPIMQMLRLFDRGVPIMGFAYFAVADLRNNASKLVKDFRLPQNVQESVLRIIDEQWETFATDMHAAAYLLNPRYWHLLGDLIEDKELKDGLRSMINKLVHSAEDAAETWRQFKQEYVRGTGLFSSDQSKAAARNENYAPHAVSPPSLALFYQAVKQYQD